MSLFCPSLQILGKNPNGGISDFQISGQYFINENCHNSRISHNIYVKTGPETEIDKRNTVASKALREIFKSISQINPELMWSFFKPKKLSYNLRKGPILNLPRTQSTYYGTNAIHFRGSLIWNNLPAKVKSSNSVFEFKTKIKNLGYIDCGCLICR